jgi:RHS repeat-associated protein
MTGACSNPAKPAGTSCSDGNACNGLESCDAAAECQPGTPVAVDDGDPCTSDTCDPATGAVSHAPAPAGTPCPDADKCNGEERCDGMGKCVAGPPPLLDDGDACTVDQCDPATGVVHHPCSKLDLSVATSLFEAAKFLFSGPNPPQKGVAAGTIKRDRIAVLRGRVLDLADKPLAGVRIRLLPLDPTEPSYGETATDGAGEFSMATNGGAPRTLVYEKSGFPPLQRTVEAPVGDYEFAPDVVLTPYDKEVTAVDTSGAAMGMQLARASIVSDASGARQATILFPAGTQAALTFPDGSSQPTSTLHVRLTEYTVGASGPRAMPALLPPTSEYTYALELSADEAVAAGTTTVAFNQPVVLYLENYYLWPTSTLVPTGFYDRAEGRWKASPLGDGIVVAIVGESMGLAELDFDADGIAEGPATFSALGVSEAERAALAQLYEPGASLWRVPIDHFSTWDCNQPPREEGEDSPKPDGEPSGPNDKDKPCEQTGSRIECQNQILAEEVPVAGTPFSLHYQSDRVAGRSKSYELTIPLVGDKLPDNAIDVVVEVKVAGRKFFYEFACTDITTPGQSAAPECQPHAKFLFAGRLLQGPQPVTVRVGYTYFRSCPANLCPGGCGVKLGSKTGGGGGGGGTGGKFYGGIAKPTQSFARWPEDATFGTILPCIYDKLGFVNTSKIAVFKTWKRAIGPWSSLPLGLGGLSLSAHHGYSPGSRSLHLGDGRRRTTEALEPVLDTIAGGQPCCDLGDGGPALEAYIGRPRGVAVGLDGSVYFTDENSHSVRRIAPDGTIHAVSGGNGAGFSGDFGPAKLAQLFTPLDVAVGPDGSLYIADFGNNRIRRVTPGGIIHTVAGSGATGVQQGALSGDGGPAIGAELNGPSGIAVGPDSSFYIADRFNHRVRVVYPDGVIATMAGGGSKGPGNVGIDVELSSVEDVALGPDGSVYIANGGGAHQIYKVVPGGKLELFAGTGTPHVSGDGGPATLATLDTPTQLAVASDGSVYVVCRDVTTTDDTTSGVRRVGLGGLIHTVVADHPEPCAVKVTGERCGEDGPAAAASPAALHGVAVSPDGSLYLADATASRLYRVGSPLPGVKVGDYVLPSEDASELYFFDEQGRHRKTRDALLGIDLLSFGYDDKGLLATVTDLDGLVTSIAHDSAGNPTAVVGPFGHKTVLETDAKGYIASVSNPLGETHKLSYVGEGLLSAFERPKGNASSYFYDAAGLLVQAFDPPSAGGSFAFARTEQPTGRSVTLTTALGRKTLYDILESPDGSELWTVTGPDGLAATTDFGADQSVTTSLADGTSITLTQAPDPRFGMLAPLPQSVQIQTGGKTLSLSTERSATLADPNDVSSLTSLTDKVTVNGKAFTTLFERTAAERKLTRTTAAGRKSVTLLDEKARPRRIEVASATLPLEPTELDYYEAGLERGLLKTIKRGERLYELFYDPKGNLSKIAGPLGKTVLFEHDLATRVGKKTFPDGESVRFFYDKGGNLELLAPPGTPDIFLPHTVHQMSANSIDLLASYTAPAVGLASTTTSYLYSNDRELVTVTRPDGLAIDLAYDAAGRLDAITVPGNIIDYAYNPATDPAAPGKLAAISSSADGVSLSYAYAGSLLTSTSWSGVVQGTVTHSYDNDLRISTETVGTDVVSFSYGDGDGLLTQAGALSLSLDKDTALLRDAAIGVLGESYDYNAFGELSSYKVVTTAADVYSVTYERDALGRVVRKTETIGAEPPVTTEYGYDLAGRLADVFTGPGPCSLNPCDQVGHYEYDANGNRILAVRKGESVSATYDAQDRLLSQGAATYSYTAAGELVSKTDAAGTTSYGYDVLGALRKVTLSDGTLVEYIIDGTGRRVGKKVNAALERAFLYRDALAPVAELGADGKTVTKRFIYGSRAHVPDYMVDILAAKTYRFVTDQLGSVRLVVDVADGSVAQRLDYDEWGRVLVDTAPALQPFAFAGGPYDVHARFSRFGRRDYDPEIGRWTDKDPILFLGGANLYLYALADPVNVTDPDGQLPPVLWAGIAAAGILLAESDEQALLSAALSGIPMLFHAGKLLGAIARSARCGAAGSGPSLARQLGTAGETAAGIVKNTKRITSLTGTARYRIPDILDHSARLIGEVKNVGSLSYTNQLRDLAAYAQQQGYTFELWVRSTTQLSGPLQRAVEQGQIVLRFLP